MTVKGLKEYLTKKYDDDEEIVIWAVYTEQDVKEGKRFNEACSGLLEKIADSEGTNQGIDIT